MKKWLNIIAAFCYGLFMLLVLWVVYLLFSVYSLQPVSSMGYDVPDNAEIVLKVDAKEVAKNTLLALLLEGKGEQVFGKIKSLPEKKSKQYGINWTEPITYFTAKHNEKLLQGLIVQVASPFEWDTEIKQLFGQTSAFKRDKLAGIVVQSDDLTEQELADFLAKQKIKQTKSNSKFISIYQQNEKGNAELFLDANSNKITMNGIVNHNDTIHSNHLKFKLTPSDFHFTSDLISKELNDTLAQLIGVNLGCTAISMNYRDVEISITTFSPTPDLDLIMAFENPTTLFQIVEQIPNAKWKNEGKTFSMGKRTYFAKQLDEKTIFIGANEHAEIKPNTQAVGLIISGKLKLNSMISMAMRTHPEISKVIKLNEEIQYLNIKMEPISNTSYQITSTIEFKKDQNAILKIVELSL